MPTKKPQLLVTFTHEQFEQLHAQATHDGVSAATLVRQALVKVGIIVDGDMLPWGTRHDLIARADELTDYGRNDPAE